MTTTGTAVIVAATIGATGSVTSAAIAAHLTGKVREVHDLTNSRLSKIEAQLARVTGERNRLQRTADQQTDPKEQ